MTKPATDSPTFDPETFLEGAESTFEGFATGRFRAVSREGNNLGGVDIILGQLIDMARQSIPVMVARVHENAVAHGWWEGERNQAELIALIHSELSEALEALRHGNPPSDHIPEFTGLEEELADVVIRVFDFAGGYNLRLAEAIEAKHRFNRDRPHKHGKAF